MKEWSLRSPRDAKYIRNQRSPRPGLRGPRRRARRRHSTNGRPSADSGFRTARIFPGRPGKIFANNANSRLWRWRRCHINVCFGLRFRLTRRSRSFFHNCRIALRFLFGRRIGNRGFLLLTSRKQCGASQNADTFLHD